MGTGWIIPHRGASRDNRSNRALAWPPYSTGEGVTGGSFDSATNIRTLIAILRKVYLSLGYARADETYTSFPIEI